MYSCHGRHSMAGTSCFLHPLAHQIKYWVAIEFPKWRKLLHTFALAAISVTLVHGEK